MNNSHFRKLLGEQTPARAGHATSPSEGNPPGAGTSGRKSIVPMTPRNVKGGIGLDFARQVRERNAAQQPTKKFKSHAPKGVKLGAGYIDRAKARDGAVDTDDKAERIKALEEQMKLGQISQHTFESLRDTIAGGDVSSTHLVKGLDRKLLERVKRGEDVLGGSDGKKDAETSSVPPPDVDDELDKLGEQEVQTVQHEEKKKKGTLGIAGKKRNRDEIMAELKAQRKAAADAEMLARPQIELDNRWIKVGTKQKPRIEIDAKGREVLITVDEDGIVSKKVRKVALPASKEEDTNTASIANPPKDVWGADVPIPQAIPPEQKDEVVEDDDIFDGVGAEYNPLGDDEDDDEDEDEDDENVEKQTPKGAGAVQNLKVHDRAQPEAEPSLQAEIKQDDENSATVQASKQQANESARTMRNYFNDKPETTEGPDTGNRFAGIENVLKKAAQLDPLQSADGDGNSEEAAKRKKRAEMLAQQDRDMADMDMGFGSSRFEDEQDGDGGSSTKMKLSEWKGGDDDGWAEGNGKSGEKKKRKPKKRKGDVNNAADIMRVIEGRKKQSD